MSRALRPFKTRGWRSGWAVFWKMADRERRRKTGTHPKWPALFHYRSLLLLATDPKKREPLLEEEAQFKAFSQEVMNRYGNPRE